MNPRAFVAAAVLLMGGCGDEVLGFFEEGTGTDSSAVSSSSTTAENEGSSTSIDAVTSLDPMTSGQPSGSSGTTAAEDLDPLPDFVAYGFEDGISVSHDDGQTWTLVADPAEQGERRREDIVRGGDRILIVGGQNTLVTFDGLTWEAYADPLGYARGVAFGDGGFVSVGLDRLSWSDDGIGWVNALDQENIDLQDVTYGDGRYVAVGIGTLGTSTNGQDWSLLDIGGEKLTSVAYGNGRFVAVGEEGRVLITEDGSTVLSDNMNNPWFEDVRFIDGEFVALAGNVVGTSDAGVTWKEFTIPDSWGLAGHAETIVTVRDNEIRRGSDLFSLSPLDPPGAALTNVAYTATASEP